MESREFVKLVGEWISEKNGTDVEVINISNVSSIGDYFVIATGTSDRQVKAIADNIEYHAEKLGISPKGIEGEREARWILLDFSDVIVHIFHQEDRAFYNLERLWKDGVRPSNTEK